MEIRSLFLIVSGMKFWLVLRALQAEEWRQEDLKMEFLAGTSWRDRHEPELEQSVRMIFVPSNPRHALSWIGPSMSHSQSVDRSRGVGLDSSSSGHDESLPAAHWLLISLVSSDSNLSRGCWGFCYCCLNGCKVMLFNLPLHPALPPHCDSPAVVPIHMPRLNSPSSDLRKSFTW